MVTRELREGDAVEVRYVRLFDADLWALATVVSIEPHRIAVLMLRGPEQGQYKALQLASLDHTWRR